MSLEEIKRGRTPLRRQVTRLCNELGAILDATPLDKTELRTKLNLLQKNNLKLQEFDNRIMDMLVSIPQEEVEEKDEEEEGDEDAGEEGKEFDEIQTYQEKIERIQVRAEVALESLSPASPTPSDYSTAASELSFKKKTFRLPKIELPKFDGDLKNWLGWWSQFEKIDQDDDLHASDKFQYLLQATEPKSEPREIISSFPPTGENYAAALDSLKRRYGREGLQLQVYLRELLNLVIVNVTKKEKISLDKLYLKLESYLRALNTLDLSKAEPSLYFYPLVESCLPEEVLRTWLRSPNQAPATAGSPQVSKLDSLMGFLQREVEGEQQIILAKNAFQDQKTKNTPKFKSSFEDIPTAASLYNKTESDGCIFCGKKNHESRNCFTAPEMSTEERRTKVRDSHSCYCCLKKGHSARNCRGNVKCTDCSRRHLKVMCPGDDQIRMEQKEVEDGVGALNFEATLSNFNNSQNGSLILMKTLIVHIRGHGGVFPVRLLFDEGSQRSYVKTSVAVAAKCQVTGEVTLQNSLFGGIMGKMKSHKNFKVTLEGIEEKKWKSVELVGEDKICTGCPSIPHGPWINELARKKIYLTDTYQGGDAEVHILIGSDLWGSVMTGKMVKLENGLVAVQSIFGWTLSGRVPVQVNSNVAMTTISMMAREEKALPELRKFKASGIRDSTKKTTGDAHEIQVKKKLNENASKDEHGRYVNQLPWTAGHDHLPTNKSMAEDRLITASDKLIKRGELQTYGKMSQGWVEEKTKEADDDHLPSRCCLPSQLLESTWWEGAPSWYEKENVMPEVGDIVLVGADDKKRYEWPQGRIMEVYPGNWRRDSSMWMAKVQTATSILERPIQRLYPLEISKPIRPLKVKMKKKKDVPSAIIKEKAVIVKTQRGREIKAPQRYGQWNV